MANSSGRDILIQVAKPQEAATFYAEQLGFGISSEEHMLEMKGPNITLYIDKGPEIGPVLEVFVTDVENTKKRLVAHGCTIVREDPEIPRCYVRDPYGLVYNIARRP